MKFKFLLFSALFTILAVSCTDVTDMGSSLQTEGDKIGVYADTFHLSAENHFVPELYSRQDSFLLGTFYDEKYGTTQAEILTQVEHPQGHVYPANTVFDSVELVMYYNRWFGDNYSPMQIKAYQMNLNTFAYRSIYPSSLNPSDYTDLSTLMGSKTITAKDATGKLESNAVIMKLSNGFLNSFTNIQSDTYSSTEKFQEFFKGMYITAGFGSATMLYITQIELELYYHYTYITKGSTGQDSTVTVKQHIPFPANKLVRSVNRFVHPDIENIKIKLQLEAYKKLNYISSPANIYTRVNIPVKRIGEKIIQSGKRLSVNDITLRVDVDKLDSATLAQPKVKNILLVKESKLRTFFGNNELPADTSAVLGTLTYATNKVTGLIEYYYQFNISTIMAKELTQSVENNTSLPDSEKFLLVPVTVGYNSSSVVESVKEEFVMSAISLCGAGHPTRPMRISIVYSQF